jgi:hypothetical protein
MCISPHDTGSKPVRSLTTTIMSQPGYLTWEILPRISHQEYSAWLEVALVLNDHLAQGVDGCLPYSLMVTKCGATKYMWYKGLQGLEECSTT